MAVTSDLTLERAIDLAQEPVRSLLQTLSGRLSAVRPEMEAFQEYADRADELYYPSRSTQWGPDLWPDDPSARVRGRAHVSVNTGKTYVDLPATLESISPIENMVANANTVRARKAAENLERLYFAWKREDAFELKFRKACVIKQLYGRTAARPYWDPVLKRVCVEIIERPQRLYLGYQSDTYDELEWAAYLMRMTPNAVRQAYKVSISDTQLDSLSVPFVSTYAGPGVDGTRTWLASEGGRIDVWDYWYREWSEDDQKLQTYNVVIVGNVFGREPTPYSEYKGRIPYLPLVNSFLPNQPNGRAALYDVEHLIREKYETVTKMSQMITGATAGDYWQLVGQDAPARVPTDLQPKRNEIVAPGPGNRIETIVPFIAQFQAEQYLTRIDREMEVITGLNDLLLGLAPAVALGSSRAIDAFENNYSLREDLAREILYDWRRRLWEMVLSIWVEKDKDVRKINDGGGGTLDLKAPNMSPRNEMDTATRAANLMNAMVWSQRRAMDATGVDDPETEQDMIREERTDATMFPAGVQVMAQLLGLLQQLGVQPPQNVQNQAQAQAGTATSDLRNALGAATPGNTEASQAPADQGATPPGALSAGATPPSGPFVQAQQPQQQMLQTMIQNGRASNRILTQQKMGRRPPGG